MCEEHLGRSQLGGAINADHNLRRNIVAKLLYPLLGRELDAVPPAVDRSSHPIVTTFDRVVDPFLQRADDGELQGKERLADRQEHAIAWFAGDEDELLMLLDELANDLGCLDHEVET